MLRHQPEILALIDKAMVAFKKAWCKYDNCGEMPLSAIRKK
jgi:hypothetical protein